MAKVAGLWPGEFTPDVSDRNATKEKHFRGYLQLYLTDDKFKMEMNSPQQGFTVQGKWKVSDGQVEIHGDTFAFDNPTEEDQKTFGMKLISPEEIRATFNRGLVFKASPDRKVLAGLKTSFGSILGTFRFERPLPQ